MLHHDPRNDAAVRLVDILTQRLPAIADDPELDVVVGGDGFMLHTVAEHGFDKVYLGLNAGRVGFLMNESSDVEAVLTHLGARAWRVEVFPTLHADLVLEDGTVREIRAVNDVALERSTGQTAHLRLAIDGTAVVDTLVADGIIFSTALGSTAYTFSAGGPACHPTLPLMVVTAICPHRPRLQPFVLHDDATAHVHVLAQHRRPVRAVADGETIDGVRGVRARIGRPRVQLAWLPGSDFTTRMITKIVRP